jgi:hypothetical protein
MMISPLRILILYRQVGFVHTHALYSIEAPWLPKSESGTRSPSLHLRHRGNAFSTNRLLPSLERTVFAYLTTDSKRGWAIKIAEGEPPPLHPHPHSTISLAYAMAIIPQNLYRVSTSMKTFSSTTSSTRFFCSLL